MNCDVHTRLSTMTAHTELNGSRFVYTRVNVMPRIRSVRLSCVGSVPDTQCEVKYLCFTVKYSR